MKTVHDAGLAREMDAAGLGSRLGWRASRAPTPDAVSALLDDYYRGDGLVRAALRRPRHDRYVVHRAGERASASTLVMRLRLAAPELGPVAVLEQDTAKGPRIMLHSPGARAYLHPRALRALGVPTSGGHVVVQRTVPVCALAAGFNALLAARGIDWRYLPVDGPDDIRAFLGVNERTARILDRVDLFDAPLEALTAFADWRTPSSRLAVTSPGRRDEVRHVA